VRELTIAARSETVWEFLVDADKAKRWMGIDATLEAHPGGLYRVEVIEFELEEDGDGTRLRFVHRDLPTSDTTASHAHGWDHYLPRLVEAASGGDPGRDPWIDGEM
jgi:hypothetical protein